MPKEKPNKKLSDQTNDLADELMPIFRRYSEQPRQVVRLAVFRAFNQVFPPLSEEEHQVAIERSAQRLAQRQLCGGSFTLVGTEVEAFGPEYPATDDD